MAPKRTSRLPKNPPPPSEPEEETGEGNPEEEEDVMELGVKNYESGEGEEWVESDNPPSPSASGFEIKPVSPKRRPRSKDSGTAKKRSSKAQKDDENVSRSKKKAKISKEEGRKGKSSSSGPSSAAVGKVWCEEDQITVLQGLIDFKKENGGIPNDMAAFHEFIKGKLLADISRAQLYDKVRRLKKKFLTNKEKIGDGNGDGEEPVFSKPHDFKAFDLSNMIWGTEDTEKEDLAGDDLEADAEDFLLKYPNLSESFYQESSNFVLAEGLKSWLKDKWSFIGSAKAEELEKKWQEVREEEAKIFVKKMDLLSEQTKLLLGSSKNM